MITNEELLTKTKQNQWSDTIRKKRLSWYGHVCRLDASTPAQTALNHIQSNNTMKKLKGGQKTTWIKNVQKDLDNLKIHPQENITELTLDRSAWRQRCKLKLR